MAELCRCERCSKSVRRSNGAIWKKAVFVMLYATLLPYAWLLFVAGPGLLGVIPFVVPLGLSIGMLFGEWAFPRALCPACGASLEYAPVIQGRSVPDAQLGPAAR